MSEELIARLEKATGPSRVVDFEIHLAAVGDPIWPAHDLRGRVVNPNSRMSDYLASYRDVIDVDDQDFDFPRYTVSTDAALTLLPEWCSYELTRSAAGEPTFTRCRLWDWRRGPLAIDRDNEWKSEGNRPLPFNICISAFKARAASPKQPGDK